MASTPGRPSMLIRMGKALMGEPVYGLIETCPGTNVCAPGCKSACEITAIWPLPALSHMMSSAPLEETRVRKNTGGWLAVTAPTEGKLSTIFHPFTGKDRGGARGTGSLRRLA